MPPSDGATGQGAIHSGPGPASSSSGTPAVATPSLSGFAVVRLGFALIGRLLKKMGEGVPRSAHLTFSLCVVMVISFGVWASVSTLDIVSMAQGEVIPSTQVKTVQHLEGGIVREILVREGGAVTVGQPLIVLEPTASGADVAELRIRLTSLIADVARLDALSKQLPAPIFPDDFVRNYPDKARQVQQRFESQSRRHESELRRQEETIVQRQQEIREIISRIESSRQSLKLLHEQIQISEALLVDNITNRFQHLDLLKERQRLQGGIESDSANLEKTKAGLLEARAELEKIRRAFAEDVQKSLDEARLNRDELTQRIKKFEDSLQRTVIRTPVDGIVKTLKMVTVGGVLRPGDAIADIVPAGDRLIIEAKLPTRDIGYVAVDQNAIVKLASPDAIRFGGLKGKVIHVGPDTLLSPDGMPFYKVRIATELDYFQHGNLKYSLFPGMQVIASIQTGKRTVLEYVLDPVRYYMGEAGQER